MIDLTPLDIRKKRGDFRKGMRGYDPPEVDGFLELVAERMEELVKETSSLRERCDSLEERVKSQDRRERAVQEALVTAQKLRDDIQTQAHREAELAGREAEAAANTTLRNADVEAQRILKEAEARLVAVQRAIDDLERRRNLFIKSFRRFLEGEMEALALEEKGDSAPAPSPPSLDYGRPREDILG
jgi:cell division initiation protein